eukprot:1625216-Pleurochrysis_carterae.AAC.9
MISSGAPVICPKFCVNNGKGATMLCFRPVRTAARCCERSAPSRLGSPTPRSAIRRATPRSLRLLISLA